MPWSGEENFQGVSLSFRGGEHLILNPLEDFGKVEGNLTSRTLNQVSPRRPWSGSEPDFNRLTSHLDSKVQNTVLSFPDFKGRNGYPVDKFQAD